MIKKIFSYLLTKFNFYVILSKSFRKEKKIKNIFIFLLTNDNNYVIILKNLEIHEQQFICLFKVKQEKLEKLF